MGMGIEEVSTSGVFKLQKHLVAAMLMHLLALIVSLHNSKHPKKW